MQRDLVYLEDVILAADTIMEFIQGRDLEFLVSSTLLQSALALPNSPTPHWNRSVQCDTASGTRSNLGAAARGDTGARGAAVRKADDRSHPRRTPPPARRQDCVEMTIW